MSTIDMTPSFQEATQMCLVALESGTPEGKRQAKEELLRYAAELDRIKAAAGSAFEVTDTPTSED